MVEVSRSRWLVVKAVVGVAIEVLLAVVVGS